MYESRLMEHDTTSETGMNVVYTRKVAVAFWLGGKGERKGVGLFGM